MKSEEAQIGRRRVPRRNFETAVGLLLHGKYQLERCYQVGEGGILISSVTPLVVGENLVLSFFLTAGLVMVRGAVRSVVPPKDKHPQRFGIEFLNLGFQSKREIRNFVAAATRLDGHTSF